MQENPVAEAFTAIRAAIAVLSELALWSRHEDQALGDARECWGLVQALDAVYTRMVGDLEGRALPDGLNTLAFLRASLHRTAAQAGSDIRAATNRLPKVADAFATGEISRAHVDVITRTVARIPEELLQREIQALPEFGIGNTTTVIAALDEFFAAQARLHDSYALGELAKTLLAVLDPDQDDGFDPDAYDRRQLTHTRDDDSGMWHGTFNLPAPTGADLAAAIAHFSAPNPKRTETADDGSTVEIIDARTPAQRRADALGIIARLALASDQAGTRGGEPPRIVLHTGIDDYHDTHCTNPAHTRPDPPSAPMATADDLAGTPPPTPPVAAPSGSPPQPAPGSRRRSRMHGATDTHLGAIGPALLARFACDAVLQVALMHPTGAILDLGRDARTVSTAQRRALTARDRGCIIPGCTSPAAWCDGHHVTYWEQGGLTDLDNLVLLCGRHHTAVHLGLYELRVTNGLPWARATRHVDPHRRWIRNTYHDDLDAARGIGTQLRLTLRSEHPPGHEQPATDSPTTERPGTEADESSDRTHEPPPADAA